MKSESKYISATSMLQGVMTDILGTSLTIKVVGLKEKKALDLWADLKRRVSELLKLFDMQDPQSEACLLNANAAQMESSAPMMEALNICEAYFIRTERLFDISVGEKVDFTPFTKGFILRELLPILKKAGAKDVLLDFGREVLWAAGKMPYSDAWQISLIDPQTEDELDNVSFTGKALAIRWEGSKASLTYAKDPLEAHIYSQISPKASSSLLGDLKDALGVLDTVDYE